MKELRGFCDEAKNFSGKSLSCEEADFMISEDLIVPSGRLVTFRHFTVPAGITFTIMGGAEVMAYGLTVQGELINRGTVFQGDLSGEGEIQDFLQEKANHMKYPWIDEYLMKKPGVTRDLQKDWNWIRYQLDGKMFAAVCRDDNDLPYYITLKLTPLEGDFWRSQYEDIIPGYYMNKMHWNSVKADGNVPDDILQDLLDKAYRIVLGSLSKKRQKEILESSEKTLQDSGS